MSLICCSRAEREKAHSGNARLLVVGQTGLRSGCPVSSRTGP